MGTNKKYFMDCHLAGRIVVIPFIIYAMRKPSWRDPSAEFAPFHFEQK